MNKEQEDLIATGLWLLIKSSDKLKTSEKQVWIYDYDKLFPEEKENNLEKQRDIDLDEDSLKKGFGRSYGYPSLKHNHSQNYNKRLLLKGVESCSDGLKPSFKHNKEKDK